jgi:hypothetical protein
LDPSNRELDVDQPDAEVGKGLERSRALGGDLGLRAVHEAARHAKRQRRHGRQFRLRSSAKNGVGQEAIID